MENKSILKGNKFLVWALINNVEESLYFIYK